MCSNAPSCPLVAVVLVSLSKLLDYVLVLPLWVCHYLVASRHLWHEDDIAPSDPNKNSIVVIDYSIHPHSTSMKRRISTNLVKSITLKTCGANLSTTLHELYPAYHRQVKLEGVEVTVDYADTYIEGETYNQVIVAVHGLPGNYTHFDQIIQHFRHTSVRVVVPNLPSFADTRRTKAFWHTTLEKAQFLRDFLGHLNIDTIDCLISHSFGMQTIAAFWENPGDVKIKSVCMFAPQPLWDFDKTSLDKLKEPLRYRNDVWYNILSWFKIHKLPSMPMKFEHINEFLLFCTIVIDQKHRDDLYKRIDCLLSMPIPVTVCYGSKESLIPKITIDKLYRHLGIDPERDVVKIDPENDPLDKLVRTRRLMCYSINGGKHFAHANFHKYSNTMVEHLLDFQSKEGDNLGVLH